MQSKKSTKNILKAGAVLAAVLGLVILVLVLSGATLPFMGSSRTSSAATAGQTGTIDENGVQNVTTAMESTGRYPAITVKAGVPVVWTFKADAQFLNGCNSAIVIPDYNIQLKLKPGDNIIKFTPTEAGTQIYTCWMGMVRGKINVVDGGAPAAKTVADAPVTAAPGLTARPGSCCGVAPTAAS